MRDALGFFKPGFAFLQIVRDRLQGVLDAFAIFDVGEGSVPFDNPSTWVAKRDTTHQKPSVLPISGTTKPRLIFERLPGGDGDTPMLGMARKIVGMDRTLPTSARTLLDRKPGVFDPTLIHEYAGAVRGRSEGHRRDCVDRFAEPLFFVGRP